MDSRYLRTGLFLYIPLMTARDSPTPKHSLSSRFHMGQRSCFSALTLPDTGHTYSWPLFITAGLCSFQLLLGGLKKKKKRKRHCSGRTLYILSLRGGTDKIFESERTHYFWASFGFYHHLSWQCLPVCTPRRHRMIWEKPGRTLEHHDHLFHS